MAYSVAADIEKFFGAVNVADWCAIDTSADATARKAEAIAVADDFLNALFRASGYSDSIDLVTPESVTPPLVRDLSRKLAGLWLFDAFGAHQVDKEGNPLHRFHFLRTELKEIFQAILKKELKLNVKLMV